MLQHILMVAVLFFVTSIDTILLILNAIHQSYSRGRKAYFIVFCTLCAVHPIYSYAVDTVARLPGLRFVSALLIIFFAFRLSSEPVQMLNPSPKARRTAIALIGTTIWLDVITSVDTSVLVSATSPSFAITAAGNVIAMALLLLLAPRLYRLASEEPWLNVSVASFVAFSAVLQLRGEPMLGSYTAPAYLFPVSVATMTAVAVYGWHKQLRQP